MKKFRFITMALIAMFMASCSNEEIATPEQEPEYVTVNLGITGEYLDLSDSPLATRSSTTTDVYGINVYSIGEGGSGDYAFGYFSSLTDVKIKLLEGKKYKFEVGIIANDEVYTIDDNGPYFSPIFCQSIKNEFSYSGCSSLNNWQCAVLGIDYYYGQSNDYTPTKNGTAEIATKRVVYGAHFIAEGLTEGSLSVGFPGVNLTPTNPENNNIYVCDDVYAAWEELDASMMHMPYTEKRILDIKWTKDDGFLEPLGQYSVTFRRNVKTTIRIKVKDKSDISNGIVITREEAPMTNDDKEYVIEVEDGTITEVPVTTTQQ
ncbi:MAG: hypothetical protein IKU85_02135 [Bacteroidaceae bacterium]|nr:hypothetical protein [Bacteroidaceae bacterium]